MKDFFLSRLIQLIQEKKAPHFIIFTPSAKSQNPEKDIETWINEFLELLAPKTKTMGHQDVHIIACDYQQSKAGYTKEHSGLSEWFDTQYFKPIELPVRLIILKDAQNLSVHLQNKCLKLLEEPQENQLILWFKNSTQALLPTIESRAMQLRVPAYNKREKIQTASFETYLNQSYSDEPKVTLLIEALNSRQWQEVAQLLQKEPELEKSLLRSVLEFETLQDDNLKRKAQLLQNIKWFDEAASFGNQNAERWTTLLSPYFPS
jgi:DNA polymerase III delta prime subunit